MRTHASLIIIGSGVGVKHASMDVRLPMIVYSFLLSLGLVLAAPWWGWRMLTSGRYRDGLAERLGRVPPSLRQAAAGRQVIWLHAVSVGEVLAVTRLVTELQAALPGWLIAVSTTTATGQRIARERLGPLGCPVFFFPLDFAFAVRPYLRALKPRLLLLVEGELWPRVLAECSRAAIPVAVVNARVSDRSFARTRRFATLWLRMARQVTLFLAQGEETAVRLRTLGVAPEKVQVSGNLKYEFAPTKPNPIALRIRELAGSRKIIVAGSTLPGVKTQDLSEEEMLLQAWQDTLRQIGTLLVLAPRHPARFPEAHATAAEFNSILATDLPSSGKAAEIIILNTLGDLSAVYEIADVAFIGGSLVPRGGHNPLEAARFGVPIVVGRSYENFREIVQAMQAADAICVSTPGKLAADLQRLLDNDSGQGQRGKAFYESQAGATERTLAAILDILSETEDPHA